MLLLGNPFNSSPLVFPVVALWRTVMEE